MNGRAYLTVMLALFAASAPFVNPHTRGDGFYYLAHLRSWVVDGDAEYYDELAYADLKTRDYVLKVWRPAYFRNKYAVGSALLWAPYYVPVHAVSRAWEKLGYGISADGFASQYLWVVAFATALYAFAGLLLTFSVLARYFPPAVSFLAVLGVWFATSLPAYMYFHPTMAHAPSFFASALFLFAWTFSRPDQTVWQAAAVGAAVGLAALVRTQEGMMIFIPLGDYVWRYRKALRARGREGLRFLVLAAVTVLAAAVCFTPQLVAWKVINGSFFRTGYENTFTWFKPHLCEVLFSNNHGAFLWTPVVGAAAAGLILFFRRAPAIAAAGTFAFVVQWYIVASWGCWWQASSFGGRMLIGTYPFLACGLAAVIAASNARWWFRVCAIGLVAAFIWNFNLLFQFGTGMIPRDRGVGLRIVLTNSKEVPQKFLSFGLKYIKRDESIGRYFAEAR